MKVGEKRFRQPVPRTSWPTGGIAALPGLPGCRQIGIGRAILWLRPRSQQSNVAGWLLRWDQITHTEHLWGKSSAAVIIPYVTLAVISVKGEELGSASVPAAPR